MIPKTLDDLAVAVQIAADLGVPITARGGGTSLSGPVDRPRRRHRLLEVPQRRRRGGRRSAARVRVQPGVVLDHLNRALGAYGLIFGPDVATASRATLGGMIGNNSAGARSVVYGQTVDHVRSLDAVLSDGTRTDVRPARRRRSTSGSSNCGRARGTPTALRDAAVRENAAEIEAPHPEDPAEGERVQPRRPARGEREA